MNNLTMREKFKEIFSREGEIFFFAPGRVNLIGEHTDYNGGHVLPCAIGAGTYALAAPREDGRLRLFSLNYPEGPMVDADTRELRPDKKYGWACYPLGVAAVLKLRGHSVSGADILFWGDLPEGAGLSSSASIEILTAIILKTFSHLDLTGPELAAVGQATENDFIGVHSGIMDQFIVACGQAGQALLLNCETLAYEYVPLYLGQAALIIIDSGKRRGLADSKYNQRRAECQAALAAINSGAKKAFTFLGEISPEEFELYAPLIEDEILMKRARHVIDENRRTLEAAKALAYGELADFGRLMCASHASLRDDYEVTGPELDALVEIAQNHPAALGARMTGAGFGGCAVAFVRSAAEMEDFRRKVADEYLARTGYTAAFYPVTASEGARPIEPELMEAL
ncbi:galactokinase [Deltaproteobacteria bacterium Smac51]|nr:galactokinase [Deltaproteobacteria bacterium Smac51]